ncbi:Protein AIR1 [Dictyocoela muelleri]|nr:Protein AIR1 [Dictyocoela muelleri]
MKEIKSLMDLIEEKNNVFELNLDNPLTIQYLKDEGLSDYTEEDILSLFFHYKDTEIKSDIYEDTYNLGTRYFGDSRICYSCGESGHIESTCPSRNYNVCILCGSIDHEKYNCPQMVCSKCNKCGHRFKDCQEHNDKRRFIYCRICPYEHPISECPMSWRNYRNINRRPSRLRNIHCSICYSNNHFIDDCGSGRAKYSVFTLNYKFFMGNPGNERRRSG